MLSLPIPVDADFPIIQYADDTIIALPADLEQLNVFKDILNQYAAFTGLKINFHKSSMIPINLSDEEASFLAEEFNCQLGSMPFTYLGLPMGTTKPSIKDLSPLTDRVERRLSAVSSFLSYGDRLVLVNSVLSSLPTYFLLSLKLPPGIIDVIDRARRHCLWKRKDKDKINSLAAWDLVCRPKNKGGLGIINLRIQNNALLLKHLHKFYNNEDIPWIHLVRDSYYHHAVPHAVVLAGSFWWRNIISLSDEYRSITKCEVGNGNSVLFWSDQWKDNMFDSSFPRLFSYAKDKLQSVREFFENESVLDNFHLPLSVQAHEELTNLQVILHNASLNPESNDSWIFKLGNKGFKSSKVYKLAFDHIDIDHPSCWIWKSKCISKHKFLAWLILHDRINTKDMILRRHWKVTQNHNCVLCQERVIEDWRHLFFNCNFSTRIWNYLQIPWIPGNTFASLSTAKRSFKGPCFTEIVIISCWCIWKQRNGWIFKNIRPTFRSWRSCFIHEVTMLKHRVKNDSVQNLLSWIENLP
jgi:hypothetical protein